MRRIRSPVRSPAHASEIQERHQDRGSREHSPREELNQSAPTSESTPSSVRRRRPNILELAHNLAQERGQFIPRVERNQSTSSLDIYGLATSKDLRLCWFYQPLSSGSSTGEEATEH